MKPKQIAFLLVLMLPVLLVLAFVTFRPILVLPRIKLAPGFALTDQDGARLTNEDLRGKIVLYTFTYTHCEEGCPEDRQVIKSVQRALSSITSDIPVEFVTISFDPQRDTPQRLSEYIADRDNTLAAWHIVTGEPTHLKQVIGNGFTTYYTEQEDGTFKFDPAFILVDGWGIMRAEYRTAAPEVDLIMRDIDLVTTEARNSTGAARYAYEAAHLFVCYPR